MNNEKEVKTIVRNKYTEIATQEKSRNSASCCGATSCGSTANNIMNDDYSQLAGYIESADLGLGCGLPTEYAQIQKGDTVVDLGSGAGNDCFVARHETGADGRVIGIDFTPAMIDQARKNTAKLGYDNVEFIEGEIDDMPLENDIADVIVSNCVLNLVPDKSKVFSEIYRVLKPGGHFSISDIVLVGTLPDALRNDAEMYAGCVSGAIQKSLYLEQINNTGFVNVAIQKEKPIIIPEEILAKYLDAQQIAEFNTGDKGIYSITVFAQKP